MTSRSGFQEQRIETVRLRNLNIDQLGLNGFACVQVNIRPVFVRSGCGGQHPSNCTEPSVFVITPKL